MEKSNYQNDSFLLLNSLKNAHPYMDEQMKIFALNNYDRFNNCFSNCLIVFCKSQRISPKNLFYNDMISNTFIYDLKMWIEYEHFTFDYGFYQLITCLNLTQYMFKPIYDFYKNNKKLISNCDFFNIKVKNKIKKYFDLFYYLNNYEEINLKKINNCEQLNDVDHIYITTVKNICNLYSISDAKYRLCKLLFETVLSKLVIKINDIEKLKLDEYDKNLIIYIKEFIDSDNLFESCLNIINNKEKIENMFRRLSNECVSDIIKNISIIDNTKDKYKLDGQDFKFLIHAFSNLNSNPIGCRINSDYSEWIKNPVIGSIISTSLINNYSLRTVTKDEQYIGFSKLKPTDVLDIGSQDLYSIQDFYMGRTYNSFSRILNADGLINETEYYNEIVLRRYKNGLPIMPDYIVSFNNVNEQAIDMSHYFKVPMYIIDVSKYLIKMQEHLKYLREQENIIEYSNYLKKYEESLYYDINKQIDINTLICSLSKITDTIVNIINNDNRFFLISEFKKIVCTYLLIFDHYNYKKIELDDVLNKIKIFEK